MTGRGLCGRRNREKQGKYYLENMFLAHDLRWVLQNVGKGKQNFPPKKRKQQNIVSIFVDKRLVTKRLNLERRDLQNKILRKHGFQTVLP